MNSVTHEAIQGKPADDRVPGRRRPTAHQKPIGTGGSPLLPIGPGLGFDPDARAAERWTLEGWT